MFCLMGLDHLCWWQQRGSEGYVQQVFLLCQQVRAGCGEQQHWQLLRLNGVEEGIVMS